MKSLSSVLKIFQREYLTFLLLFQRILEVQKLFLLSAAWWHFWSLVLFVTLYPYQVGFWLQLSHWWWMIEHLSEMLLSPLFHLVSLIYEHCSILVLYWSVRHLWFSFMFLLLPRPVWQGHQCLFFVLSNAFFHLKKAFLLHRLARLCFCLHQVGFAFV